MKKTAIILGATGLTGGILLQKLIDDERYEQIKLFSRSKMEGLPSKVTQYIGDLLELEQFRSDFIADEVFCCIGTTTNKTPDKTLYKQIDYGIPVNAAKLAKDNGISTFLVISAMGADQNSSVFYNKTKGEMERDVLQQQIKKTYILRPALIDGNRDEKRAMESIGLALFKLIDPLLLGPLKKYKMIAAETIAQTMLYLANHPNHSEAIISSTEIKVLSEK
ncbi:nucleoside-diphosphate sugar epimerase [Subsaximicrobium wynnwilliamsii]|uniref:Nucleoside-diphosphate sugar epimerase n=1 Tax=Subsaximicrobium wynnwilliamsii TaxID=291179 RepID=A0A5C6ZIX0_9FLAO|nr:NAD(P)H-binding protein [Subsaximicrobium wynnwilliamsii]TXD84090.1 nucleoside-diphosphate sugar epimerase [Subsaximicrobium wynnwilliamsii]TXD88952.1 nucleoside-diphosphate sugar epimerase [Subsaximicrobium wynnwilliamsii]TXE03802.1 nucleoside-diphosphate sugar epimerase [Subsaximicrobium wynnwilliamsii]